MDNETQGYNGARPEQGKGLMTERTGNTNQPGGTTASHPEGVYRHPLSGAEIITQHDPLLGDGQSRAAVRAGFEYLRPVEDGEIKELGAPSSDFADKPDRGLEAQAAYNKGVEARLNALEDENARLRNQVASGQQVPGTEPVKGAEDTKQAAADKTADQTGTQVDPTTGAEDVSFRDLQAQAKDLGVNAKGSKEELTQRVADAKAEKENNDGATE